VNRITFTLLGLFALPQALMAEGARAPDLPASNIAAPRGPPLSGAELDARTQHVGALLRCPVCQGLSVADSPATMARNMKAEVREKLAKGYDQEQILAHFERSYGEFVRLEPPVRGVNWLVWLGPLAALLAGGTLVAFALRRPPRDATPPALEERVIAASTPGLPSRDTLPGDPRLAAAVRRARSLAYGWPHGVPPKHPAAAP